MNEFKAITTVYSYYLPEIQELITRMTRDYPHEVFLRSITPGLDDFHQPVIDRLIAFHGADVPGLSGYAHRYPTAGAEEGIREYLTFLQGKGVDQIYMWEGDYEGYREVAKTRNIEAVSVPYGSDPRSLSPGYWFLSDPCARNGMIVPVDLRNAILEAGHKMFYDLSYLGTTPPHVFDASHPNIEAVTISFSKPYGLFYYRIGFTLFREAIPTLYANKWFKNIYGLLIADKILGEIDQTALAKKYKAIQAEIVAGINRDFPLGLSESDAFLLAKLPTAEAAQLPDELQAMIARYRRGEWFRFCLTPYFLERSGK
jgi:histidinol-phosphate/aromatic aminotransferase/cobyric acid decarboxylase-like protein